MRSATEHLADGPWGRNTAAVFRAGLTVTRVLAEDARPGDAEWDWALATTAAGSAALEGRADLRPLLGRLTDEELHRERLYWWRRHVTLGDDLAALAEEHEATAALATVLALDTLIGGIREALDAEERTRERARARGVPREGARGWVPDEVIAEVKRRVRLAELVERYTATRLRSPRGSYQRQWGPCPFHEERTPSFCVWTDREGGEHWQCFGACATGGDAIAFAQRALGVSFREAVEGLASAAGVDWPPASPTPPAQDRYLALVRDDG